jgi:hypothetical protein
MVAVDVDKILARLAFDGVHPPTIERALELPAGTLDRWRQDPPPEGLALLRLIRVLPWLLDVANYKYDAAVSRYLVIERAARILAAGTEGTDPLGTDATARAPGNPP